VYAVHLFIGMVSHELKMPLTVLVQVAERDKVGSVMAQLYCVSP
jgi:hypothetical protein